MVAPAHVTGRGPHHAVRCSGVVHARRGARARVATHYERQISRQCGPSSCRGGASAGSARRSGAGAPSDSSSVGCSCSTPRPLDVPGQLFERALPEGLILREKRCGVLERFPPRDGSDGNSRRGSRRTRPARSRTRRCLDTAGRAEREWLGELGDGRVLCASRARMRRRVVSASAEKTASRRESSFALVACLDMGGGGLYQTVYCLLRRCAGIAVEAGCAGIASKPDALASRSKLERHPMANIHHEIPLSAPPARVYQALVDSKSFADVTGAPASGDSTEGATFSAFGGHITGRHVELVPNKRVVQAWRAKTWPEGAYSIVRFELRASTAPAPSSSSTTTASSRI